jgi:hypothetical protein
MLRGMTFKPNPAGIRKYQEQAQRAIEDLVQQVARDHAGADAGTIRSALVSGAKRRGFADYTPSQELIDRIANAPRP